MQMSRIDWGERFDEIQTRIKNKEYAQARDAIDKALTDAHRTFADPTFLIRELRRQRREIEKALVN